MHLPDVLSPSVIIATTAGSAVAVGLAAMRMKKNLGEERAALVGVLGAFVFAAQMVKIPYPLVGFSGHLGGATLLTVLLGPSAAIVTMFAILVIQATLFQDGALLSLGANTWNLGVVQALISYAVYRLIDPRREGGTRLRVAAATGAWLGLVGAAVFCGLELKISQPETYAGAIESVVGVHLVIGVGEAVITLLCLEGIRGLHPAALTSSAQRKEDAA